MDDSLAMILVSVPLMLLIVAFVDWLIRGIEIQNKSDAHKDREQGD